MQGRPCKSVPNSSKNRSALFESHFASTCGTVTLRQTIDGLYISSASSSSACSSDGLISH